jgi:hypothetical protein
VSIDKGHVSSLVSKVAADVAARMDAMKKIIAKNRTDAEKDMKTT